MGSIAYTPETLNSLAAKITELAARMTKQLEAEKVSPVTLEADSPIKYEKLPDGFFMARQELEDAMKDMYILSQGPSESVYNWVHTTMPDLACLNILNQFNFWTAVPVDGSATFDEIAKRINLPVEVVDRVLHHAVTQRFFTKPSPSATSVSHTSRSAALAKDSGLCALVQMVVDEAGPPMMVLPEALRRFSQGKPDLTKNVKETAFKLCHSGGVWGNFENSWDMLENDGEGEQKGWRQRNFVNFMAYIKDLFHTENLVLEAVDWKAAGDATVVDIGGSAGHDDIALARTFPNLKIVVQDLPTVAPVFEKTFPADLKERVSFLTHNMFDPQPAQADIFMLKWILHDWPDAESVAILQALRPGLKPGARVVFVDYVGKQEPSDEELPRSVQAYGTAIDLRMMALFSAKERPVSAWKSIFKQADERYDIVSIKADPMTFMCVLEAVWRG
ncbi:S-adenosyl-L-methionine-dependent methyltransferase [Dothidotthia symphoricarpi CBS 119687]|uniref:S-adenosyl-L-methionine-dependent methyltransferase n=1 Tax=Dothidotthia symphoricarpi CBS 119687 TaxID=1392245 RepID=A0A6A6A4J6_9PLEO|nr:S-adenosyl-L-methionine-dependent methyltransferase [Dothidotthia symphoricarpi CBS 119687]KAF2126466.1 S-adenosyl-L-methionine-dependent methyltransferase [Dothidotthia symphoricarpi CBS 119687]